LPSDDQFFTRGSFHIGSPSLIKPLPQAENVFQAVFDVPSQAIRDGWNTIRLDCATTTTALSLEVAVN
jgi:hypothetical protein